MDFTPKNDLGEVEPFEFFRPDKKTCDLSEVGERENPQILQTFDLSEVAHSAPPTRLALAEGLGWN